MTLAECASWVSRSTHGSWPSARQRMRAFFYFLEEVIKIQGDQDLGQHPMIADFLAIPRHRAQMITNLYTGLLIKPTWSD